jgi:hypothetical protein
VWVPIIGCVFVCQLWVCDQPQCQELLERCRKRIGEWRGWRRENEEEQDFEKDGRGKGITLSIIRRSEFTNV